MYRCPRLALRSRDVTLNPVHFWWRSILYIFKTKKPLYFLKCIDVRDWRYGPSDVTPKQCIFGYARPLYILIQETSFVFTKMHRCPRLALRSFRCHAKSMYFQLRSFSIHFYKRKNPLHFSKMYSVSESGVTLYRCHAHFFTFSVTLRLLCIFNNEKYSFTFFT